MSNFKIQPCDHGCSNPDHRHIELTEVASMRFEFHLEGPDIVIDHCEGMTPEQGLSMFPDWMLETMKGKMDA